MIGLGSGSRLDFDRSSSQNLIDSFPSHTVSSVTGKGNNKVFIQ